MKFQLVNITRLLSFLPSDFRIFLKRHVVREIDIYKLRRQIKLTEQVSVVLGAGGAKFDGWFSTDMDVLDITSPANWQRLFKPQSIDRLLAEHVLEHLTESECKNAIALARHYLKEGGLFRIAVPDGYRKDPAYVAEIIPPRDGHKLLFTVDTLVTLLESHGFSVTPLEFFDSEERFHCVPWNQADGFVKRCLQYDTRPAFRRDNMFYTSLIVDAKKI